jgi:hypothetical protein
MNQRLALQQARCASRGIFRVVPLLDAGVEGVQVEVQDRSCCFEHIPPGLSVVFVSLRFHCTSIEGNRPSGTNGSKNNDKDCR